MRNMINMINDNGTTTRSNPVFDSPVLRALAETHGRDVAAVTLSWALQRGVLVLPRSAKPAHIASNARLLPADAASDNAGSNAGSGATSAYAAPLPVFLTTAQLEAVDALDGAVDTHAECAAWAASGECAANPGYMLHACHASCGVGAAVPLRCDGRPREADGDDGMGAGEL